MSASVSPKDYSVVVLLAVGSVSLLCSLLTLWLIWDMKRYNGYILLIIHLTTMQAIYDISIVMIASNNQMVYLSYVGLRCISGIASTLWTNVIAAVVFYVVWHLRSFNIIANFTVLCWLVYIPSIIIGSGVVAYVSYGSHDLRFAVFSGIYFWTRLLSIVANAVIYLMLTYKLYTISKDNKKFPKSSFMGLLCSFFAPPNQEDPLSVLTHRMKFYPIVQVLTRGAASWFEEEYGYVYNYSPSEPVQERISIMVYAIFLPIAGLGYFIIFIVMTPGAFEHLKNRMLHLITCGRHITPRDPLTSLFSPSLYQDNEGEEAEVNVSPFQQPSFASSTASNPIFRDSEMDSIGGADDSVDDEEQTGAGTVGLSPTTSTDLTLARFSETKRDLLTQGQLKEPAQSAATTLTDAVKRPTSSDPMAKEERTRSGFSDSMRAGKETSFTARTQSSGGNSRSTGPRHGKNPRNKNYNRFDEDELAAEVQRLHAHQQPEATYNVELSSAAPRPSQDSHVSHS